MPDGKFLFLLAGLLKIRSYRQIISYRKNQAQLILIPEKWILVPCSPQNILNKPITSFHGNQGSPHPLDTTKPTSHSSWLFTLFSGATPMWPYVAYNVFLPWAVSICDHTCVFMSSVGHPLSYQPCNLRAGIPPSSKG